MYKERYRQLLAGRGLAVGDFVVCDYRIPTPHQWWTSPFWIGVVEDASDDPATWNGHNSEAYYCAKLYVIPVRYLPAVGLGDHRQHDSLASLRQFHPFMGEERPTQSPYFLSPQKAGDLDGLRQMANFAARCGLMDRYLNEYRQLHESGGLEVVHAA